MKDHKHHASHAMLPDGTVQREALEAGVAYWMEELKAGRMTILSIGETPIDGAHDILWLVRRVNTANT